MKKRVELFIMLEILIGIIFLCLIVNKYSNAPKLQTESLYISPVPCPTPTL
jgi:hypothetical protein